MKEASLLSLLKENDYAGFTEFLKSACIGSVTENEEAEFFRSGSKEWITDYISVMYPTPSAERCLMISGTVDMLKKSHDMWGFFADNVRWVFESAPASTAQKILHCLDSRPEEDVEVAIIRRNSTKLLGIYLKKFKNLGEEAEKLINEKNEFFALKMLYMEQQQELACK